MKYAFISGIPASGKSYLATKVANTFGFLHVEIDEWREEMKKDEELERWVNFFLNKDEEEYWRITSCHKQWKNLKMQSEAFWPEIMKRISEIVKSGKPAIFEGVNILPHLASLDLKFSGIILIGDSFETILERNKREPRWGQTEELQEKEAEAFFYCERPRYKEEAEKYGYPVFTDIKEAEMGLLKILR